MKKSTEETKKDIKPSKGVIAAVALCVAAVVLLGSFFAYAAAYTRVLPNIYVEGIKVGGMEAGSAREQIRTAFENITEGRNITVLCCGNEKTVAFEDLKLDVDIEQTAELVYGIGRKNGIFSKAVKMLKLAFKPEHLDAEVVYDKTKLDELICELSEGKEVPATDTEYVLEGNRLVIFKAHGGKAVNRNKAAKGFAKAAVDLTVREVSFELETIEAKEPDLETFYKELTAPQKNAEYILENGEIRIEPEKVGIKVEKAKIKEALLANREKYELEVETSIPDVTAEELQKLLFRDTIGSFSSSFATSTDARASNVILTANRINGMVLMPGDVFSYDSAIGKRTAANGYKEAGVYIGNKVESGIGGGICQTSSTLYSAVLYANLEVVARTSHSLPVSYVPLGQDATIAEGYIDFKFKNNTEYPVKIVATVNGRKLTCSLLGVKVPNVSVELVNTIVSTTEPKTERTENAEIPKGYKRILNKGAQGFTVASQRIVKESGKVVKTEALTKSVYRAAPVEEEVNPADKDTPTENLKIYTPGMEIPEENPESPTEAENEVKPEDKPQEENKPSPEEPKTEENTEDEIVNV